MYFKRTQQGSLSGLTDMLYHAFSSTLKCFRPLSAANLCGFLVCLRLNVTLCLGLFLFASRCSLAVKNVGWRLVGRYDCWVWLLFFIYSELFIPPRGSTKTDMEQMIEMMMDRFNKVSHFIVKALNTSAFSPGKGKMWTLWQVQCSCTV